MPLVPDAKAKLLGIVRRGPRTVLWPHPQYGFGNLLYVLLHAYARRSRGEDVVVLRNDVLDRWLPTLGGTVGDLVIRREAVGLTDRRDVHPPFHRGRDWDLEDLDAFLDDIVLGARLTAPEGATLVGPEDVVIVVRRGDYWSVPRFRARYAFDIEAYLKAALAAQERVAGPVPRVHVVSDGLDWCRAHLDWLASGREVVTFADETQSARDHFATMTAARRLVVTNTTFGYWGGYASARAHAGTHRLVVAPSFHARGIPGGDVGVQLDPRWTIVESIPGGWVEPPPDPWDAGPPGVTPPATP